MAALMLAAVANPIFLTVIILTCPKNIKNQPKMNLNNSLGLKHAKKFSIILGQLYIFKNKTGRNTKWIYFLVISLPTTFPQNIFKSGG